MAILIEGMEMPFTCLTCDFHKCAGGVGDFCSLTKRRQFRFKNRPKDCPLIEIPEPHGRLIDASEAYDRIAEQEGGNYVDMDAVGMGLDETPTVIPASEEE